MRKQGIFLLAILFSVAAKAQDTAFVSAKPKERAVSVAAMPTLSYDRSKGFGLGATAMLFFKTSKAINQPKSRIGISGGYTTNKSWNAVGFMQLYLMGDFLRLSMAGGYADFNFQTYLSGADVGEIEVPYENKAAYFFFNPLVKVYDHLYVGPSLGIMDEKVNFDILDTNVVNHYRVNSLGLTVNYDSRNNVYNPSKGFFAGVRYNAYPKWFNNDSAFSKLMLNVNYYYAINSTMILASRFAMKLGLGNVPFVGQNYVGGVDIRGYTKGEYRGEQVYALQSEFRWRFYKRFGMVGFAGLALAVDKHDGTSPVLPGIGVGMRFLMLPKDQINVGIDAAIGRNDWGIYFRITEAF